MPPDKFQCKCTKLYNDFLRSLGYSEGQPPKTTNTNESIAIVCLLFTTFKCVPLVSRNPCPLKLLTHSSALCNLHQYESVHVSHYISVPIGTKSLFIIFFNTPAHPEEQFLLSQAALLEQVSNLQPLLDSSHIKGELRVQGRPCVSICVSQCCLADCPIHLPTHSCTGARHQTAATLPDPHQAAGRTALLPAGVCSFWLWGNSSTA